MFRVLGLCAALAMLASLFVPWLDLQFGPSFVPWDAIRPMIDLDPQLRAQLLDQSPPAELVTFGLSFAAALLFLLTAASSRFLAIIAGAMPFATLGILLSRPGRGPGGLDLPSFDTGDLSRLTSDLVDMAGPGLLLWLGSAAVLLLLGLLSRR